MRAFRLSSSPLSPVSSWARRGTDMVSYFFVLVFLTLSVS